VNKFQRHRPPPVSNNVDNTRIFRRTNNILEFLTGEDTVAVITDDAKEDGDEGKGVCEGVWNEETAGIISVAIYRVPSSNLGSSIVPGGKLLLAYGYLLT
jgi:hypothetical protein